MISDSMMIFSKLIGTLAVILVVSSFISGSDLLTRYVDNKKRWLSILFTGIIGGIFGIYGNISGFDFNGAIISVRDIGPMLSGFTFGPISGLIAGAIAGIHRLTMGGLTAKACVVATCLIGLICGFISIKWHKLISKPLFALLLSALMEVLHLTIVLIMVKPFETALDIVKSIALPFVVVNSLGFALMIIIMNYIEKQHDISIERSRLKSELEIANVIQHSLLPYINDDYPGLKEIEVAGFMEAAKDVGGDFYDIFFVDNKHIAFLIGDVSGKGVPAALFMASAKIILQNCIRDSQNLGKAIEIANNVLCSRNEAGMFVTLWVGILNIENGELKFVSAGHNPPILVSDKLVSYLKYKNGFVLAGIENMKYEEQIINLKKDDLIFLYTDGVTEADNKNHELFSEERLLNCFNNKNNNPQEAIDEVKKAVDLFIDGNNQFDDMTMFCLKWKKD